MPDNYDSSASQERVCSFCGRANAAGLPRCVNCGQRAVGTMLVAEKPQTASWWSSSEPKQGAIPPPPQVREEMQRAETVRLDEERRNIERARRMEAGRAREARLIAERDATLARAAEHVSASSAAPPKQTVLQTNCSRCGVPLKLAASGKGFSFCLSCGEEAPTQGSQTAQATAAAPSVTTATQHNGTMGGIVTVTKTTTVERNGVSPAFPAILSFLVPGGGQIANGQYAKGALLMLAMYVLMYIFFFSPMGFALLALRGVAALDAHRVAERRRKGVAVRDGEWDLG